MYVQPESLRFSTVQWVTNLIYIPNELCDTCTLALQLVRIMHSDAAAEKIFGDCFVKIVCKARYPPSCCYANITGHQHTLSLTLKSMREFGKGSSPSKNFSQNFIYHHLPDGTIV